MRLVKTAENLFGLPTGFQRVAFLESTGEQYIDTGYKPVPATTKFEFYFSPTNITGGYFLFGARPDTSAASQYTCAAYFSNGTVRQDWAGLSSYFPKTNVGDKALYSAYNNTVSLNDDSVTGTTVRSTTRLNYNFLLFTVNTNGTADTRRYIGRVYYAKLWDDGVLVRDLIPCIDPLGVPCMYDLVGKKAYYNQGTGEFTVGRQIIPVEYLESTGTQSTGAPYIDTGVVGASGLKANVKFMWNTGMVGRDKYILGSATPSQRIYFGTYQSKWQYGYGTYLQAEGPQDNTIYDAEISWLVGNQYVKIDGETIITGTDASSYNTGHNLYLLSRNNNGTAGAFTSSARVYYCKIYNEGVLIRDYIPCKDENNVGFMFDIVSGTVYENAGTGAFVVGRNKYNMQLRLIRDNILPTGYTQVEYIEADNRGSPIIVQYAVGNYRLTNTTDWEITFSASSGSNNWVMGQPTWIGVHYRKDATTGNLPRVGIANSASSASQCYVDYTDNEKITLALKGTDVYANGVKVGSITRASAGATQTKYGIFAYKDINQDLPNLRITSARIYRLKIWDNDVLVQDLVPAMKDGVAGFYERVNKTFIEKESNSTSDFTTGKPLLPIVRFPVDPVPVGYKTVNYLESTGSQYIDTGITGTNENMGIDISWAFSNNDASMCIFSSRSAQISNTLTLFWLKPNGAMRFDTTGQKTFPTAVNTSVSDDIFNFNYKSAEGAVATLTNKTTGQTQTLNTGKLTTFSTNPLYLFASRDTAVLYSWIKMYNCQIYDSNTLVRNFIPVIRLLDNKAGMWDTVTKQFYTTPTGDFITG